MKDEVGALLAAALEVIARERGLEWAAGSTVPVDVCKDDRFGDVTSNVAMELSSRLGGRKVSPRELGQAILGALPAGNALIEKAEVAGPGFLNFTVRRERWLRALREVLEQGAAYGSSALGAGARVQVEFVSANPTGPQKINRCIRPG